MNNGPKICIQVQSVYIESQSEPDAERYVFAYTVSIRNLGRHTVQLISRYWRITNSEGRQTEVQGEGVVGEQPVIEPGEEYRYTSGTVLETPLGTMEGYYTMVDHKGENFISEIPVFRLAIATFVH
ncbi:Co2+/Mg2+ efflux protein ApaG [Morganella psychrotolerans]|uniref:Protein ApaG n=1 Tax=Morganella psychrotolerans TaxID=368603 RepID=A0A5M9QZ97_9GAMM|nr:Co2+/Mg2+ efflux protein ApaG [Morganella psychrotolerans]KAA8713984.1 Co2+/Mg2+ efflux protein ApaG [Morganella psychrotolerans]OBU03271.1 Co2+/Mg2+ efflux protein ApaG [Morganella psychrotolerans]